MPGLSMAPASQMVGVRRTGFYLAILESVFTRQITSVEGSQILFVCNKHLVWQVFMIYFGTAFDCSLVSTGRARFGRRNAG